MLLGWTWYPNLLVLPAIFIYIAGCCFMAGRVDGIRDGVEGIVDEFRVFAWPLWLASYVASRPFVFFYRLGQRGRKARHVVRGE